MQSAGADSNGWFRRKGKMTNPLRRVAGIAGLISLSISVVEAQKLPTNWPDYLGGAG